MTIALWITVILLTVIWLDVGASQFFSPQDALQTNMAWVEDASAGQVKPVGALELLGRARRDPALGAPIRADRATPTGRQALSRSTMCVSMMHWCSTGSPRSRLSIICAILAPIASDG